MSLEEFQKVIFIKTKLLDFYPLYVLCKKEFIFLLLSPLFPLLLIITITLQSMVILGNNYWLNKGLSDFFQYFLSIPTLLSITIPMLTMSVWAAEKKQHTDTRLLSLPISIRTIVYGKYIARLIVWIFMSLLTIIPPLTLIELVEFPNLSFFLSYITSCLFGSAALSISLAISFASKHVAVNFFISFITIIILNIIHIPAALFYKYSVIKNILSYLSFSYHAENAYKGIFDTRDFIFYLSLIIFGLEANIFIIKNEQVKK